MNPAVCFDALRCVACLCSMAVLLSLTVLAVARCWEAFLPPAEDAGLLPSVESIEAHEQRLAATRARIQEHRAQFGQSSTWEN